MEFVLPKKVRDFFYDRLIKNQVEKFISINKNNISKKSFCPILINSFNSYLSRFLIEEIFKIITPGEKNITSNIENKLNSNKNISFNVKISKNHIEISPGEYGINDRTIVSEYINEVSSMNNIVNGNKKNIIVWNIDKIGNIAFESLHNIIKTNEDTANFICVTQSLNKIDRSIFGSVTLLNIENPDRNFYLDFFREFNDDFKIQDNSVDEILDNIKLGYIEYNFNSFLKNIGIFYNFNLDKTDNFENSFRKFIEILYLKITTKNRISDTFIEEIRNLLYDLYVYHFSYEDIINLFIDFCSNDDSIKEENKLKILDMACYFNLTSGKGNKQIIHLEAFLYNFINIYFYGDLVNNFGKKIDKKPLVIEKVKKPRKTKA